MNHYLRNIDIAKSIKRSKVKRGFKKIQGREKSFPSYGRVKMRIVSFKRPFVKLYDILCWHWLYAPVRKSHPIISSLIRVRNSTWQWIFETLWLRTGTNTQSKIVGGNKKKISLGAFHLSELTGQPIPIVIRISLLIKTNHPDQSNPKYYTQRRWFFSKTSWKNPISLP